MIKIIFHNDPAPENSNYGARADIYKDGELIARVQASCKEGKNIEFEEETFRSKLKEQNEIEIEFNK